jgi:hypothetical protein
LRKPWRDENGGVRAAPLLAQAGIPLERRLQSPPALAHAQRRKRRSKEQLIA